MGAQVREHLNFGGDGGGHQAGRGRGRSVSSGFPKLGWTQRHPASLGRLHIKGCQLQRPRGKGKTAPWVEKCSVALSQHRALSTGRTARTGGEILNPQRPGRQVAWVRTGKWMMQGGPGGRASDRRGALMGLDFPPCSACFLLAAGLC